jgi:hypothetical protein
MSGERPKMSYIKSIIEIVIRFKNDKKLSGINNLLKIENMFIDEHPRIQKEFPWICKMILKEQDLTPLWRMIKELENVENGKANFKDTEKKLSNELSDKYLKDIKK